MFRFEWPAEKAVLWGYGHGRYADAWSILHIFSGITGGIICLLLELSFVVGVTLSIIIFFAYELWEAYVEVVEDVENSLSDVVFGMIGVFIVYGFYQLVEVSSYSLMAALMLVLIVDLTLLHIGWKKYLAKRFHIDKNKILPSWQDPVGRKKIHQDQILFFGLMIASVPIAVIGDATGFVVAAAYLVFAVTTTFVLRSRAS